MHAAIPRHVVIIPDGNRRWAKEKGLFASLGHKEATREDKLRSLLEECRKQGVRYMTIWAFSSENWKRDAKEKDYLFEVIHGSLKVLADEAHTHKMRFRHFGRKDRLPGFLRDALVKLEKETAGYDQYFFQLAVDYGGRDELVRAVAGMIRDGKEVTEESFAGYLDSAGVPDPDLVIRTGGEQRLSGFMPFQSVYSELYFTKVYFPAFGVGELRKAIREFGKRKRRFGE
ncbi:MAG TPA: polyprenyl diphosphate synthase [Candidatus Nanoarchaeia archaeon]|nr:polyprenyl diphosphate synthase [Candidatus Nanoarchaeia archaeon]